MVPHLGSGRTGIAVLYDSSGTIALWIIMTPAILSYAQSLRAIDESIELLATISFELTKIAEDSQCM